MTARIVAVIAAAALFAPHAVAQTVGDTQVVSVPGTDHSFTMAYVPGGSFPMGSPDTEQGRDADEGPVHEVELSPFWMTTTEVTHELFALFRHRRLDTDAGGTSEIPFVADAITRPSPPYEDPSMGMGDTGKPATGMTRLSALSFARWLSFKTGRLFRLPTEAEWEYACRAGSDGGAVDDPDGVSWYGDNSSGGLHQVATKEPNAWALHDMHGNAAEWVMDQYFDDAYAGEVDGARDPMLGTPARGRGLVRGGAFDDPPERLRCSERFPESTQWKARDPQMPKSRWWNTDAPHVGFRLVSPVGEYTLESIQEYWAIILSG